MAKTKISEFSTTPGNNTDINGINIAEGCAPSGINNAIRELMSDLKEWQSGAMDVYVIPQGTAAAPGIQLYGDLDTGLYGYAANQLGVAVGGASAGYFSSAGWNGNVNGTITGDINATTIDTTNLEVTNIKAKDGTAAITIADSTGVVSVSTTLDLTTVEVTNIKAKDGTTSISLADSTGIATFSKATVIETTDNTNAALRITQLGTGNALLVEDATNPDTTPTVIDQFGNVILGTTTRTTPVTSKIEIHGTASELSGLSPSLGFYHWSATASLSSTLTFRHYPSGTVGTLAANTSGDVLGRIVFLSYDGTNAFGASIRGVSGAGGTAPSITYDASGGHNFTSGPIDVENLEVTNIKARDGTAAASIANSTGVMTIASSVLTTTDINGGTIDGTTIGGSTAAAGTFTTATATTGNITTVNATTVDTTNLEVTNIKAKDGTAAITITDSSGAVTVSSAFAANGGVTIGDASGDALTINSSAVSTPNGLNFDSNTFVIDATNNRVGINNASPTVALDVTGALTISGNAILGDASTDTVLVNGYMGVGGTPAASTSVYAASTALTGTTQNGFHSNITGTSGATSNILGFYASPNTAAASFTVSNVAGFRVDSAIKGAGSTITNQHGLYISDLTSGTNNYGITSLVSSGSNKWNIYASGTANNAFAGNVRIGSVTAPTNALDVTGAMTVSGNTTLGDASTDTVRMNGYMALGTPNPSRAINIESSALTGTGQTGVYSTITGTSAATSSVRGFTALPATEAAAFTATDVAGYWFAGVSKGAGSTITNAHGIYLADQTQGTNNYGVTSLVSSGTNKWNIYASGTAANYFAGNVLVGTATAGSFESGISPIAQVGGVGASAGALSVTRYSAGGGTTRLMLVNSRGAVGSPTILQNGDTIGQVLFVGDDGTDLQTPAALIAAVVTGTPGPNDMPGSLVFSTTADGAATPTERLRIDSSGNVRVGTAALATTATDGFLYIPTCAGTPTGTPTAITGLAPMVIDSTNNKLYIYSGGAWVALN